MACSYPKIRWLLLLSWPTMLIAAQDIPPQTLQHAHQPSRGLVNLRPSLPEGSTWRHLRPPPQRNPDPALKPSTESEAESDLSFIGGCRVPPETENLARSGSVTSSKPQEGQLEQIIDGKKACVVDGFLVVLPPGRQWVQIDLGKRAEIWAIAWWHDCGLLRRYKAVILQVADDPKFKEGVTTLFNNDYQNTAGFGKGKDRLYFTSHIGLGKLITPPPIQARYVRLYSHGNDVDDLNRFMEVEIYGRPASDVDPDPTPPATQPVKP